MNEAARHAPPLDGGGLWIMARRQTGGRGRLGRAWHQAPGNLAATLLIDPQRPMAELPQMSFEAALALAWALRPYVGGLSLKWPNDVLLAGQKLGGILLESGSAGGRAVRVAIGFGVNIAHSPDPGQIRAGGLAPTCLAAHGARSIRSDALPPPEEILAQLAAQFQAVQQLRTRGGFAAVRQGWLTLAHGLNGPVQCDTGAERLTGRFQTIDETGRLVIALPGGGTHVVSAGDVSFGGGE